MSALCRAGVTYGYELPGVGPGIEPRSSERGAHFLIAEPSPQHLIVFHSELILNFEKYFSPSVGVIL